MDLYDDNYCFACGKDNPIGLKMKFEYEDDRVTVRFTPGKEHQGWGDVVHGGILFTLMDEAMARLIIDGGEPVVTSRMEIKFLRPARVDQELILTGRKEKSDERYVYAVSKLTDPAGKTVALSKGVYAKIKK